MISRGAQRIARQPSLSRFVTAWALVVSLVGAGGACSSNTDIVAYRTDAPVATSPDAGPGDAGLPQEAVSDAGPVDVDAQVSELTVVGVPAANWPYAFAPWPLTTPLEQFFVDAAGDKEVRVAVSGDVADSLLTLYEQHSAEEYGPQGGPLGVRDADGAEFTIRLLP